MLKKIDIKIKVVAFEKGWHSPHMLALMISISHISHVHRDVMIDMHWHVYINVYEQASTSIFVYVYIEMHIHIWRIVPTFKLNFDHLSQVKIHSHQIPNIKTLYNERRRTGNQGNIQNNPKKPGKKAKKKLKIKIKIKINFFFEAIDQGGNTLGSRTDENRKWDWFVFHSHKLAQFCAILHHDTCRNHSHRLNQTKGGEWRSWSHNGWVLREVVLSWLVAFLPLEILYHLGASCLHLVRLLLLDKIDEIVFCQPHFSFAFAPHLFWSNFYVSTPTTS